jgi:hypothetical protein
MGEEGAPTLYTTDDTGNYVEYTPPDPPAFADTLPEDLQGNEHLSGVEDNSQLARYYVDLKTNYLAPPETPEGYEFEKPDGFVVDDDRLAEFKTVAFNNGVNQQQFSELMNLEVKRQAADRESIVKTINDNQAEAERQLKAELGDKYEKSLAAANAFLNHEALADDNFKQFLKDTRFGDNPQVIRFFSKLADLISEDALINPGSGEGREGPEKDEAGRPMLSFPSMET